MPDSSNVIDVTEASFADEVLNRSHQIPVVVDFWAPWCGPCRALSPLLEKLATEGGGAWLLAKVNVDLTERLSAEYGVRGIPAVKAFREGQVVAEFTGAQPEPRVREFIRKLAPSAADTALSEAAALLATRKWQAAVEAYRSARELDAASGPAALGLVQALVARGLGCEALDLLDEFPRSDEAVTAATFRALAEALCEVEPAESPIDDDPLDALYHQSARLFARGQWEACLDGLLDVLRSNKRFRDGAARKMMLSVFSLLGEGDPLTQRYRAELASVLF
ncbi:MAG: tetratricopeptide repeat protein [Anaerolineales bacterium]|nr:tetratricopeptide repeat protein [Anaerolineales bacterium]